MKFSITTIEYEGQWGGDSVDKEFNNLDELMEFVKDIQKNNQYVYRFIVYDPPRTPFKDYTGYITICDSDE